MQFTTTNTENKIKSKSKQILSLLKKLKKEKIYEESNYMFANIVYRKGDPNLKIVACFEFQTHRIFAKHSHNPHRSFWNLKQCEPIQFNRKWLPTRTTATLKE